MTAAPIRTTEAVLPSPCGPLSAAVCDWLAGSPSRVADVAAAVDGADPYGLDLQLALYVCYELHYRGFAGVDPAWEWNAALLALRARLERVFLARVGRDVGPIPPGTSAAVEMDTLAIEPAHGTGPSWYLLLTSWHAGQSSLRPNSRQFT